MFTVEMLEAEYGDSLWIEYGEGSKVHRILVDAGTITAAAAVQAKLDSIKGDPVFELGVVTHIDSDHIDGMAKLFQHWPETLRFEEFWFNAYEHTQSDGFLGAKQGEYLTVELRAREKIEKREFWNKQFGGKAAMLPDEGEPRVCTLAGGMKVTVLGPSKQGLVALRKAWEEVVGAAKAGNADDAQELLQNDNRFRADWLLGGVNVEKLANARFVEDTSAANGSSIILLLEYEEKSLLLCGDAHPSAVLEGLERLGRRKKGSRWQFDAVKVPHHGSKHSNSKELYEALDCPCYLISTNGKKFGHPDQEGIARILQGKNKQAALWFNYRTEKNEPWTNPDLMKEHKYSVHFPDKGVWPIRL